MIIRNSKSQGDTTRAALFQHQLAHCLGMSSQNKQCIILWK